jgi:hypothetical protein
MNRYESAIPRTAIGIAAVVMTALTFGLAVFVPAHMAAGAHDLGRLAAAGPTGAAPIEVAITPARIDVVAERVGPTAFGVFRQLLAKKDQSS